MMSMALRAAAVEAGVIDAVNMYEREWWRPPWLPTIR